MFLKLLKRCLLSCFFFSIIINISNAQPELPEIDVHLEKGIILLSWVAGFDGIKSIGVQRSSDSVFNFVTVGYVKNVKKGPQAFVDGHPAVGTNWYRVFVVFNSDLVWKSNRVKIQIDSSQLIKQMVLPPNDSLQKMIVLPRVIFKDPITQKPIVAPNDFVDPAQINAYTYIRSQYVFTNPFTGHVNVELPENKDQQAVFSLQFFDPKDKRILDIPVIHDPAVIIDKRNFQNKGLFKFELKKNAVLLETGYITIY